MGPPQDSCSWVLAQAEKDMCDKCIAAFTTVALADKFAEMMNNGSK